jgi:hypothetical protein
MSTFTFNIVNHRGDEAQLNLLLTVTGGASGVTGIEIGKSTVLAEFFARNLSHSFSAEQLVSCRLYVGYGAMPLNPDPNSSQYYDWIEFSRDPQQDEGVWVNLSNVDILGLPLTMRGRTADAGTPFSLGYKKSMNSIIREVQNGALTSTGPTVVKDCGSGRTKIVAPNIQFPFYRKYDDYLNTLTVAGAKLTIRTDTPKGGQARTFTGSFSKGALQDLSDLDPILRLDCGPDAFQIQKRHFTTEYLYRCDGGTIIYNGETFPQNRNDEEGKNASAVYTNALFRNLCVGINEGYFTAAGANDSTKFSSAIPSPERPGERVCPDYSREQQFLRLPLCGLESEDSDCSGDRQSNDPDHLGRRRDRGLSRRILSRSPRRQLGRYWRRRLSGVSTELTPRRSPMPSISFHAPGVTYNGPHATTAPTPAQVSADLATTRQHLGVVRTYYPQYGGGVVDMGEVAKHNDLTLLLGLYLFDGHADWTANNYDQFVKSAVDRGNIAGILIGNEDPQVIDNGIVTQ